MLEILERDPGVKLLVTSREALNLQEEWVFKVRGLAFPGTEQTEGLDQFGSCPIPRPWARPHWRQVTRQKPGGSWPCIVQRARTGDASAPVPPSQLDARSAASPATTQSASPTA